MIPVGMDITDIKIELKSGKEGDWYRDEKGHCRNLFYNHNYKLCIGNYSFLSGVYVIWHVMDTDAYFFGWNYPKRILILGRPE
jgi:hypothetical protein